MRKSFFKKGIVLLLAVSMVFSVAGCGKKENTREKQKMSEADKNAIYTYETIGWDEETANNMGSLQFGNDVMYGQYYEYDEETYESTQYFVTYDIQGKELSRFVVPQGWDETSSYGMSQMILSPDNSVYGIKYTYMNYADETTGEWIWDEYYDLVKLDMQGNEQWSVSVGSSGSNQIDDGGNYYYVNRILCDNSGNVWVFDTACYTCYDKDGNKGVSIEAPENSSGDIWLTKEGNFIVGQWDAEWTNIEFYEIDTKNGKMGKEPLVLPGSYYQYSYCSGADSQWDMLATNSIGVWAFNWGDTEMTKVMDFILSDFEGTSIYNLKSISDKQFIGNYYDADWNNKVATFTKVPAEEVKDKYIMTLACYYMDTDIRKQVIEFNRSHEDVRITLNDYSMYNTEDNWEAGIEKMNSDILAGNVPDILVVPSNLDISIYSNKGLFADLYEFMDKDTTIKREDYLQNIIALGEYNGELYELIPRFNAVTLIGKTSDVGEGFSWTYDDVNALMSKKGEGVRLFSEDSARSSIMYYGINLAFDQFYNSNTGECKFDSPEFIQYLELLNQFPEEVSEDLWSQDNYWVEYETQWRNGKTVLKYGWIYNFKTYVEMSQGYFGEKVSYIGFPTAEGSGSAAYVDFTFAMAEESAFKDEAWEYISYFIKDEYQESFDSGFPVKLSALDKKAEKDMQPSTWVDEETGEEIVEDYYFWIGEEELILELPTKEECQYVIDFLKNIDYRQKDVSDITAIIEEDTAAYFAGEKTAQQVADTIQSRVKIFVNEKR